MWLNIDDEQKNNQKKRAREREEKQNYEQHRLPRSSYGQSVKWQMVSC